MKVCDVVLKVGVISVVGLSVVPACVVGAAVVSGRVTGISVEKVWTVVPSVGISVIMGVTEPVWVSAVETTVVGDCVVVVCPPGSELCSRMTSSHMGGVCGQRWR